jgi:multiple sugar transport system ATP-binding protein
MTFGLRPEHVDATGKGDVVIDATVRYAEYLGSETLFFVRLSDGSELAVKADGLATERPGDMLKLGINAKACHLFDKDGKAVINGDLTR